MKILKEELSTFSDSLGYGFYKEYVPHSNLISLYGIGFFTHRYEYDDEFRLKLELISEDVGGEDVYEILYKKEFIYFEGGFRILQYRIGTKSFRDVNRTEWLYDKMVKLPDTMNNENILLTVEEIRLSNSGLITSFKKVNFESNAISEYIYIYDDLGRLISKIDSIENQIIEYVYKDNFLDYSICKNHKILHFYDIAGNEVERQYINTVENESNPLKINFNYNEAYLEEIVINFPGFGFLYDLESTESEIDYTIPKLNFNGFKERDKKQEDSFSIIEADYKKLVEILKLPSFHYLNNIEDFWRLDFNKIIAKYNRTNNIESISFIDKSNKILDKIFFSYTDNFNTEIINKFQITQSSIITNSEIVKLFEHRYYY